MKKAILWLAACVAALPAMAVNTYQLTDAIKGKLVTIKLHGAGYDTAVTSTNLQISPCMEMELTAGASVLALTLPYGYRLVPNDSSLQTMIVTQTLTVQLNPRQTKTCRLYAMCTEAHDGGPAPDKFFTVGTRFQGHLLSLSGLIHQKGYQTGAAQNAVWCLTDNYDLSTISSPDTAQMYQLRRFVAAAKGLPLATVYNNEQPPAATRTTYAVYSGSLTYSVSRPAMVLIALFDDANHMKRVFVNNETQYEGQYTYNYRLTSAEVEDKKHYLRMFRNGRLEEEITIVPSEM